MWVVIQLVGLIAPCGRTATDTASLGIAGLGSLPGSYFLEPLLE